MKRSICFGILNLILLGGLFVACTKESGSDPEPTDDRSAFTGRWNVSETYTKLSYEVNIVADPNTTDGVFIYNFGNTGSSGLPAGASINEKTVTLDPDQVIGEGWTINGSGNLSGTKIYWNYTLNDGATLIYAIATYTKQ